MSEKMHWAPNTVRGHHSGKLIVRDQNMSCQWKPGTIGTFRGPQREMSSLFKTRVPPRLQVVQRVLPDAVHGRGGVEHPGHPYTCEQCHQELATNFAQQALAQHC